MNKFSTLCALSFVLYLAAGCASTSEWPVKSGFLNDYKGMYRSPHVEEMFVILNQNDSAKNYTKFMIDPVTVYLLPGAKAYELGEAELETLAVRLRKLITEALDENYTIAHQPAADVLRIKVAITDIIKSKKDSEVVTIEADLINAQSNKRVAAAMTSLKGCTLEEWAEILKYRLDDVRKEKRIYTFDK